MRESSVPLGPVLPFPDPRVCFPEIQVELLVYLDLLMGVAHLRWSHGVINSRGRSNNLLEKVSEIAEVVSLVAVVFSSSIFALAGER